MEPDRDLGRRGELQIEESRRSFDRQVAQLKDIDDKAMRSVRTAVVVIGFVVTGAGILARNGQIRIGSGPLFFAATSVFFLGITVVSGVGTYTVTEYRNRLTDAERTRLDQPGTSIRRERAELLRIYRSWLVLPEEELEENAKYLTVTLFSLTIGMLNLLAAGALAVLRRIELPAFRSATVLKSVIQTVLVAAFVVLAVGTGTRLLVEAVDRNSR